MAAAGTVSEGDSHVEREPTTVEDDVRIAFVTDPEGDTVESIEQLLLFEQL